MVVSMQLKKQMIIEIIALILLIGVIVYSIFAIQKSNDNKVSSQDGMVIVIDDTEFDKMTKLSDGKGLDSKGVIYTVTNNNEIETEYKIVIVPNIHDENVLKQVRVSTDDLYIENLIDLERESGGYVVSTSKLGAGFTKRHLIKTWFKLDTLDEILNTKIDFEYRLVKEEK